MDKLIDLYVVEDEKEEAINELDKVDSRIKEARQFLKTQFN
jgi:hypothetical protein